MLLKKNGRIYIWIRSSVKEIITSLYFFFFYLHFSDFAARDEIIRLNAFWMVWVFPCFRLKSVENNFDGCV